MTEDTPTLPKHSFSYGVYFQSLSEEVERIYEIAEAARASALFDGRPSAGFDDVDSVAVWAVQHRIVLEYRARSENITSAEILKRIMEKTKITNQELPKSVSYN